MNNVLKKELNTKEGIYIHSSPKNSNLYDIMWNKQHSNQMLGVESWGIDRIEQLYKLFSYEINLKGTTIIDLCCGLGRMSAGCLELGANYVVSADGSFSGLKNVKEKFRNIGFSRERHAQIQLDMDNMSECFNKNSFDVAIHYYALQHIRDYKFMLNNINYILKPGGILAFNYFNTGTTSNITYELRTIFLNYDINVVYNFLCDVGKVKGCDKKIELKDCSEELYPFAGELKKLYIKYGIDEVEKKFHFEDFTTTYLHNFNDQELIAFVENNNYSIINASPGRIVAKKLS
jgi:ubiquinone/menaquinone biosynthesis C-methylase UbiE